MVDVQRYKPSDLAQVIEFLREVHLIYPEIEAPEPAAFQAFAEQPANLDGRDFWLACSHSKLLGLLLSGRYQVTDRDQPIRGFRIITNPVGRALGATEQLLTVLNNQDANIAVIQRTVLPGGRSSSALSLESEGFSRVQTIRVLRRQGPPPQLPKLADGFTVRDAEHERDTLELTRLQNAANRMQFGFAPLTTEELAETMAAPGGRLLVLENPMNEVIGSVQTLPYYDGYGVLYGVQVASEYRSRGFGRYLVSLALSVLAQSGFRCVELSTDATNVHALALYEKLGFQSWREDATYERLTQNV
ncbi:MAG: GNAT family N-acetyltransferase [Bradymonadia bacterium]